MQMEAYRDQYAKLFNDGRNVVVVAVSVDPDTALASWARDLQTPILFASDVGAGLVQAPFFRSRWDRPALRFPERSLRRQSLRA